MTALTDPDILPDSVHAPPKPIVFLLFSHEYRMWWLPDACGYTNNRDDAGRYSQEEAVEHVVNSAYSGVLSLVTSMVAAPDNWGKS